MSKTYNVSEMITIATDYANRMKDADAQGVPGMNLVNESIAIKLDKTAILNQLNADPACDGLLVVFALNDGPSSTDSQSIITVPCDSNDKALMTNGSITGLERWSSPKPKPKPIPPLSAIVNDPGGVVVGVTKALQTIGIS